MWLLTPDTSCYSEYNEKGKFLLTWRLTLLFAVIFLILSTAFTFIDLSVAAFYYPVFISAFLGLIFLHRTKKYQVAFWVFCICASVICSISMFTITPVVHYAEFFWIACIVIFSFIGLGKNVGIFFVCFHAIIVSLHLFLFLNTNIPSHRMLTLPEKIGTTVELLMALAGTGYLMFEYIRFNAYSEERLRQANEGLEITNYLVVRKSEENEMLAKEIHHRVKNNLQIVVSLLRMHSDEVKSEDTKRHFGEAISRVMTMSIIHEKLYQEKELSVIRIEDYLRDLTRAITVSGNVSKDKVEMNINTHIPTVGLKTIVPLGLLLNELLTNSLKHAFNDVEVARIDIALVPAGNNKIRLDYSDNGTWTDAASEDSGFGLELIGLLTTQLDGTYSRFGSNYEFVLSNLDH